MIKIRDANSRDETALRGLWQCFMTELHAGKAPTKEEAEFWGRRLQSQVTRKQVIVADDGQHIQGFTGFIDHEDRPFVPPAVAFIVDLYVTPAFRRQAIGVALLRQITQRAGRNGYERMWTNTEEWNRPARRCLETAGFDALVGFELPGLKGQRYCQMNLSQGIAEPEVALYP